MLYTYLLESHPYKALKFGSTEYVQISIANLKYDSDFQNFNFDPNFVMIQI